MPAPAFFSESDGVAGGLTGGGFGDVGVRSAPHAAPIQPMVTARSTAGNPLMRVVINCRGRRLPVSTPVQYLLRGSASFNRAILCACLQLPLPCSPPP